jgi:hypothetical protein
MAEDGAETMSGKRSMSERQRVVLALHGQRFPRVGDRGLYTRRQPFGQVRFRGEA